MDIKSALTVATARLWYAELKDMQKESIKAFASGKDVFLSLPTDHTCNIYYIIYAIINVWRDILNKAR